MVNKSVLSLGSLVFLFVLSATICSAAQTLTAQKVTTPPVIDGIGNDAAWNRAGTIITHDKVADLDITLKAVYTDDMIFFQAVFPDQDESRFHRSWEWNKEKKEYESGKAREDTFVFKWSMEEQPVDLSAYADNPYKADIWYWKADRTNPAGYADDKLQRLSPLQMKDAKEITSKTGNKMYLQRTGDPGKSAYKSSLPVEYEGEKLPRFEVREPVGSRGDIRAKGVWKGGTWTIELARKLNTGDHENDIRFDPKQTYQFGVSRFEIAGREPDDSEQPLFGSGDVTEELTLTFSH